MTTPSHNTSSSGADRAELEARVRALEEEIAQVKRQWPKHSLPPALLIQLEDLEEDLAAAQAELRRADGD